MIKINVILNNIHWKKYLKNPNSFIDKKISLLNKKNKLHRKKNLICTLLLSGTKEIKKLNKKFRNKNKSTDVLSFPFYEKKKLTNEIKRENEKDNYVDSILILTNGFNKTFGKNINIFNLNEFTEKNINYKLIKDEIKIFVEVSSAEIYSSKTYFTKNRFNDIYNF